MSENPKAIAGRCKLLLELIPRIALVQEAAVLGLGADRPAKAYGRWDWRDAAVDAETYLGAMEGTPPCGPLARTSTSNRGSAIWRTSERPARSCSMPSTPGRSLTTARSVQKPSES